MTPQHIRPIAICVFHRDGRILVTEAMDTIKQETFYRPIGGGIEFGEHSSVAVQREIYEELSVDVSDLRFIGTLENLFIYQGQQGHEIVQVYDAKFKDMEFYSRSSITVIENNGDTLQAFWKELSYFSADRPLYPHGLLQLLCENGYGVTPTCLTNRSTRALPL